MLESIAIIGKPNVGKSSLFNKLTSSRKSIVSDFPGLTRDRNYSFISIKNKKFFLVDTGGIGNIDGFSGKVSQQAWQAAEESSIVLFVIDGSQVLDSYDLSILQNLRKLNKPFFVLSNKADLKKKDAIADLAKNGINTFLSISAEHSINLDEVNELIYTQAPNVAEEFDKNSLKFALIGRPNAGKSTLANTIIRENKLITSEVAGTTIDSIEIEFDYKDQKFSLIDTAGIRRKNKKTEKVEYFSFVKAIQAVEIADVAAVIVDAKEGIVDQDIRIINLAKQTGKPCIIFLNKFDLLNSNDRKKFLKCKELQHPIFENIELIEISALKRQGISKALNAITALHHRANKSFTTPKLNKLLNSFLENINVPGIKGREIKIKFVNFGGNNPTTLILHGNITNTSAPSNFKRFLEKSFNKALHLQGVTLKLIFKKSENPFSNKKQVLTDRQIKKKKRLMKHVKSKKR